MMTNPTAQELIKKLGLKRHLIEDGYISNLVYQSSRTVQIETESGFRNAPLADTTYFLYEKGQWSPWHRMRTSDEVWIHQIGGTLLLYIIDEHSNDCRIRIERLEPYGTVTIPAGSWFAVEMDSNTGDYCLSTIMVCPAFNILDFQLADQEVLRSILKNDEDWMIAKKYFNSLHDQE